MGKSANWYHPYDIFPLFKNNSVRKKCLIYFNRIVYGMVLYVYIYFFCCVGSKVLFETLAALALGPCGTMR